MTGFPVFFDNILLDNWLSDGTIITTIKHHLCWQGEIIIMRYPILSILLLVLMVVSASVSAASERNTTPEVIKFKMGDLTLPFHHLKHQKSLNNECQRCHGNEIGKIDNWGEVTAHLLCINCHELMNKGPTECIKCHYNIYSKK
jgi:hypothetical protein